MTCEDKGIEDDPELDGVEGVEARHPVLPCAPCRTAIGRKPDLGLGIDEGLRSPVENVLNREDIAQS